MEFYKAPQEKKPDPNIGIPTRSEFEITMSTIKSVEEIPQNYSEKAKNLLTEYLNGDLNKDDVKFYLDKRWLEVE